MFGVKVFEIISYRIPSLSISKPSHFLRSKKTIYKNIRVNIISLVFLRITIHLYIIKNSLPLSLTPHYKNTLRISHALPSSVQPLIQPCKRTERYNIREKKKHRVPQEQQHGLNFRSRARINQSNSRSS